MNQRQKELLCKAIELGATCWISVDGDVCCAWLADDNTARDFHADATHELFMAGDGQAILQRLQISGTDHDIVSF